MCQLSQSESRSDVSLAELELCTDNAKISRKRSKLDNHGHGKGKRIQESGECYQ
ncbi:hypothetical protein Tco_1579668, partial [Tanacetum coccineum]